MADRPIVRAAARVVVLDPDGRVLLLGSRLVDPGTPPGDVQFWYTPGGGVEDGESLRAAAARELAEETGLVVEPSRLEGPVWFRRHVWTFAGLPLDSRETFFVLRDVVHEVVPAALTELELLADEPHRWWAPDELGGAAFVPADLPALLPELLAGPWAGPPRIAS